MVERKNPYWERAESYRKFQVLYIQKYGEKFPLVTFNLDDQGSKGPPDGKDVSMTYPKDQPERRKFCVPDWTFWHWPSSEVEDSVETFKRIAEAGESKHEVDKVAWFGNTLSAGPEVPEHRTRKRLVNHFGKQHPFRFDFQHAGRGGGSNKYISMPDLTRKYRWLLDIGGAGYSGRTKFLLFSRRPLLMVERRYIEYFSEELKPWEHYVPVKENLSDLVEKHEWLKNNDEEALRIAERAKDYALKNFTMEKVLERLRRVFLDLSDPTRIP